MLTKSRPVYQFWCEYDIGLENIVFATERLAWDAGEKACSVVLEGESFEDLKTDGLVGIDKFTLYEQ